MTEPFIQLSCGEHVSLVKPDMSDVRLRSLASSMARMCRFNGATNGWWSVAAHSTFGSKALLRSGDVESAKNFLFHDAHEALIGDIITPVATVLGSGVTQIKHEIDRAIDRRFGVGLCLPSKAVREMDAELLYREWCALMVGSPESVGLQMPDTTRVPDDMINKIRGDGNWERDLNEFLKWA